MEVPRGRRRESGPGRVVGQAASILCRSIASRCGPRRKVSLPAPHAHRSQADDGPPHVDRPSCHLEERRYNSMVAILMRRVTPSQLSISNRFYCAMESCLSRVVACNAPGPWRVFALLILHPRLRSSSATRSASHLSCRRGLEISNSRLPTHFKKDEGVHHSFAEPMHRPRPHPCSIGSLL